MVRNAIFNNDSLSSSRPYVRPTLRSFSPFEHTGTVNKYFLLTNVGRARTAFPRLSDFISRAHVYDAFFQQLNTITKRRYGLCSDVRRPLCHWKHGDVERLLSKIRRDAHGPTGGQRDDRSTRNGARPDVKYGARSAGRRSERHGRSARVRNVRTLHGGAADTRTAPRTEDTATTETASNRRAGASLVDRVCVQARDLIVRRRPDTVFRRVPERPRVGGTRPRDRHEQTFD